MKMSKNNEKQAMTSSIKCKYCNVLFTLKGNCVRHERRCASNPSGPSPQVACPTCNVSYIREDTLKAHLKKGCSNNTEDSKMRKTPCLVENCNLKFYHKVSLISHLRSSHKDIFVKEPITKSFPTFREFFEWKELEEESTFSYFSLHGGTRSLSSSKYYYCQHDGSAKVHSERKTNRSRAKGRIKKGNFCIAKMKVWQEKNKTIVKYFPTHSHVCSPDDVVHHPLPHSISMFIDDQIDKEVSPAEIFQKVTKIYFRKNSVDVENSKMSLLFKKRIRGRARIRRMALRLNEADANAMYILTQENVSDHSVLTDSDFYSFSESQIEHIEDVPTKEDSASDEEYSSVVSEINSNLSIINSYLVSTKQNKVETNTLSHVNDVLSDIVLILKNDETAQSDETDVEPMS